MLPDHQRTMGGAALANAYLPRATKNLSKVPGPALPGAAVAADNPASVSVAQDLGPCFLSPEFTDQPNDESTLAASIEELWSAATTKRSSLKRTRTELAEVRERLGQHLAMYRGLLLKRGCKSKWGEFLLRVQIPRTTADRFADQWERAHSSADPNFTSGEIREPEDAVTKLIRSIRPRILRVAKTPENIDAFLERLVLALREEAAGSDQSVHPVLEPFDGEAAEAAAATDQRRRQLT